MSEAMNQAYTRFMRMYADSELVRSPEQLELVIRAAGLTPEQASEDWLRGLNLDWVYHKSETPFQDPKTNDQWRKFMYGAL